LPLSPFPIVGQRRPSQDLIGDRIEVPDRPFPMAYIESGRIKGITVLGPDRSPTLPSLASARKELLTCKVKRQGWYI
jgi:hypothetical protein